jgi:hypothetical protein
MQERTLRSFPAAKNSSLRSYDNALAFDGRLRCILIPVLNGHAFGQPALTCAQVAGTTWIRRRCG